MILTITMNEVSYLELTTVFTILLTMPVSTATPTQTQTTTANFPPGFTINPKLCMAFKHGISTHAFFQRIHICYTFSKYKPLQAAGILEDNGRG